MRRRRQARAASVPTSPTLVALLVCLIPTTIGGLLSAIGIAGMDRVMQANIIAKSGKAVEVAGDVDMLLLDKTGTITIGNRQADRVRPGRRRRRSASWPTRRSSPRWPTRRPRARASSCWPRSSSACASATLARARRHVRRVHRPDAHERRRPADGREIRKGAADADRRATSQTQGGTLPAERRREQVDDVAAPGGDAAAWSPRATASLGVIELKDIVKPGITRALRASCARMGIAHRDGHRRQPADRRGDRRRGRRRRLPRRGHARGQARATSARSRPAASWWP